MKLSIVIPNYIINDNLLTLLRTTLYSFSQAKLPEHEIILVDDASPVGGGYMRDEADIYIRHGKNQGFIRSVNDGLRASRGDIIAVANNDIKVHPNFFDVADDILDTGFNVYSVHPRMIGYDDEQELGDKTLLTGRERWCQSSFFIMKNRGFMFPEDFKGTGGAYEDWYFWSDIRERGFATAYTTKTCFNHWNSATTRELGEETKHHDDNRKLFKNRFNNTPEDYYKRLYPDQMKMDYGKVFREL